jgi:hypothetical protein
LLIGVFGSRLPFRAELPFGLDSIQLVLALDHFDVRLHQPHPPGYFLFVMAGRLSRLIVPDANSALVFLNIVFSGMAVWLVFLLSNRMFGVQHAFYSAIFMASSPLFWHHGEVALSNMADCFLVCLLALLCWKTIQGGAQWALLSGIVLGVAGGVRQNTLVFLIPFWVFSIRKADKGRILASVAALMVTCACWYLPMTYLSGGVGEYQSALRDHWTNSNWHGFTLEWLPFNFVTVGYFILAGMGIGSVVLFVGALLYVEQHRRTKGWCSEKLQFFCCWILPPLSFFLFVYSHPIQTGHSLIYLPALFMLLPAAAKRLASRGHRLVLLSLVGLNVLTFLFLKTPVSVDRIRQYESNVRSTVKLIRENCPPEETILLNFDLMFVGFRDFMFHLPEYRSYQPRIYTLNGRPLLFAGFERKTYQVDSISFGPDVKYFVLYADEVLRDPTYLQGVQLDQFPNGQFLTTSTGLRFFRASVKDLQMLLPKIPLKPS